MGIVPDLPLPRDVLEKKKSDDKYLRVQSKATSIVRKEMVPLGDKLRLLALFRFLGCLTKIYATLAHHCYPDPPELKDSARKFAIN